METSNGTPHLSGDVERYIRERVDVAVDETVPAIVSREEDRRFRQFKWMAALIGLVGLGTFGTLSNYLIEKAVESKLEARTGKISDSLEFIRFNSISLKLDLGTSFSNQDRSAVMAYLRKASGNDNVRFTPEFLASLTQVVESFTSASLDSSIDEIVQLYERELFTTDSTVEILVHHYGQRIVVHAMEPQDESLKTFQKLESISSGARVPELALAYRVLYTHRTNSASSTGPVRELLVQASMLDDEDLQRFFREILQRTVVDNWQRKPSMGGRLFEQVCRNFFSARADDLASITSLDRTTFLMIAEKGVSGKDVAEVAKLLSAAAKNRKAKEVS